MIIVNQSTDVEAPTSVLSTLPKVLADHGYYAFGVNTTKVILEYEGLSEPAEIHRLPPENLASMFNADAICSAVAVLMFTISVANVRVEPRTNADTNSNNCKYFIIITLLKTKIILN